MKPLSRPNILFTFLKSVTVLTFTSVLSIFLLVNSASAATVDKAINEIKPLIVKSIQSSKNVIIAAATQVDQSGEVASKVNINDADIQMLSENLKGIGLKKAQAIVDWREQNGNFISLEQLLEVKGIGEKTLLANRALMRI